MLARITRAATRAAPSLCMPAPSWSIPVRYLGTSVLEARHRIFGDSLNRDPSPFKALANLQSSGGFKGPKIASYYPKPHLLMRHPVYRLARNEDRLHRLEVLKKLGKAPPKKGQGKRAGKKK